MLVKGNPLTYIIQSDVISFFPLDVDKDFLHFVKILVSNIFSKKNMATKQMNRADVRGKEMVDYIEVRGVNNS